MQLILWADYSHVAIFILHFMQRFRNRIRRAVISNTPFGSLTEYKLHHSSKRCIQDIACLVPKELEI
jgi:hypothetical protein